MSGALRAARSVTTTGQSNSNARLLAELQCVTLAIRMFGLDALEAGLVTIQHTLPSTDPAQPQNEGVS